VATNFGARSGNEKTRLFRRPGVARAVDVAEAAFEAMLEGRVLAVHGVLNLLGAQGVRFLPRSVVRRITASLNSPP
jgi:short-subunit dehydrogenase